MTLDAKHLIRVTLAGYMAGCADHPANPYADVQPEWGAWDNGYCQGEKHRKRCGVVVSPVSPKTERDTIMFIESNIRMVEDLRWLQEMERAIWVPSILNKIGDYALDNTTLRV